MKQKKKTIEIELGHRSPIRIHICNTSFSKVVSYKCDFNNIYVYGGSVSRLEGFVSNREQSYEDPIEE